MTQSSPPSRFPFSLDLLLAMSRRVSPENNAVYRVAKTDKHFPLIVIIVVIENQRKGMANREAHYTSKEGYQCFLYTRSIRSTPTFLIQIRTETFP